MVEKDLNQVNYAKSAQDLTKEIVYESNINQIVSLNVDKLKIIHFNDVYNVDPNHIEPKAGAARFLTAVNYVKNEQPCLVLFSGDCFSPSSCN